MRQPPPRHATRPAAILWLLVCLWMGGCAAPVGLRDYGRLPPDSAGGSPSLHAFIEALAHDFAVPVSASRQAGTSPASESDVPPLFAGDAAPALVPESGFAASPAGGFRRQLPASWAGGAPAGVLLARSGEQQYTAGLGWLAAGSGENRMTMNVLRQQRVGGDFEGQWLASLRGNTASATVLGGARLQGELAVARADGSAAAVEDSLGARMTLSRPRAEGLGYDVALTRYGRAFQPAGGGVQPGRREVAADLSYPLWDDVRLGADAGYAVAGPDCERHTGFTVSGDLLEGVSARLETSVRQALECGGPVRRLTDRWQLMLAESAWSGWRLKLALSGIDTEFPASGADVVDRQYRLEGSRDWRFGAYSGTFGPAVSMHIRDAGTFERRVRAGFAMDIDSRWHRVNLSMGYQSLSGEREPTQDEALNVDLSYELDFGA